MEQKSVSDLIEEVREGMCRRMEIGIIGSGKTNLRQLIQYLQENPNERERMNQCFNCRKIITCNTDKVEEDGNGMCKSYQRVGQ